MSCRTWGLMTHMDGKPLGCQYQMHPRRPCISRLLICIRTLVITTEMFAHQPNMTCKFTLHGIVPKEREEKGDDENKLPVDTVPGPDSMFLDVPRRHQLQVSLLKHGGSLTAAGLQLHPSFLKEGGARFEVQR